jgi:hypothetical protein
VTATLSDEPAARPAATCGPALEIRRALDRHSLLLAAMTSLVLAVPVYLVVERFAPGAGRSGAIAVLFAVATFGAITLLHVTLHAYFGWRFARGIRAAMRGRTRLARRLLALRAWPGMAHYDASGEALRAWQRLSM